jgi:hypothetical protein
MRRKGSLASFKVLTLNLPADLVDIELRHRKMPRPMELEIIGYNSYEDFAPGGAFIAVGQILPHFIRLDGILFSSELRQHCGE